MTDDRFVGYEWVTDGAVTSYSNAGCLTVVVGMLGDNAVRAVGADPTRPVASEDRPEGDGLAYVSVAGLDDAVTDSAVVLVEDNSWEGSRSDVLKRLSRKGKAASVFWNVDGMVIFACARRGKVLASIELPDPHLDDDLPASLRRTLEHAPEDTDPIALALVLSERFTGLAVPQVSAVAQPTVCYAVTEPVLGLRGFSEYMLRGNSPGDSIIEAVQRSTPAQRRRLAEWAARTALDRADIGTAREVTGALAQFGAGHAVRLGPETNAFRRQAARWSMAANEALAIGDRARVKELWHWNDRYWALEALAYTGLDDDLTAALGATYCASIPYGERQQSFLDAAVEVVTL